MVSCIRVVVILNADGLSGSASNFLRIVAFGRSTLTALASREPSEGRCCRLVPALPLTLPATPSLCYKPSMRKWMSERLKRRKKAPEKPPAEAAQAPLQPKYFDAHESGAAPEAEPHDPEPSAPRIDRAAPGRGVAR